MIMSFKCSETEKIFHGRFSKRLPQAIQLLAARKLTMLHFAKSLTDLRIPPANRLEALSGDRAGQHAIRINRHAYVRAAPARTPATIFRTGSG
jgi:toxin HigB-1